MLRDLLKFQIGNSGNFYDSNEMNVFKIGTHLFPNLDITLTIIITIQLAFQYQQLFVMQCEGRARCKIWHLVVPVHTASCLTYDFQWSIFYRATNSRSSIIKLFIIDICRNSSHYCWRWQTHIYLSYLYLCKHIKESNPQPLDLRSRTTIPLSQVFYI